MHWRWRPELSVNGEEVVECVHELNNAHKATYDKTVSWRCLEDPTYRMSPLTRAKMSIGCSICRQQARAEAKAVARRG